MIVRLRFVSECIIALLVGNLVTSGDVVTEWNELMLQALRSENAGPTGGSRTAALVHAAIYDAVNSIVRTHEPYQFDVPPTVPGALPEAGALAAAYHTLSILCPSRRGAFDAAYASGLGKLPEGEQRAEGLRIGQEIAKSMLESRSGDGSSTQVPYIPSDAPGAWRRTLPDFRPPLDPHWGFVKPFVIPATVNFPVPPPPDLASPEYAEAYEFTKVMGALKNSARSEDQTKIGLFWAYDRSQLGPVTILYNRIVRTIAEQQNNSLPENARLFALVNLARADAGITCWKAKYQYNYWRPVTAIRAGQTDDNPLTEADPTWEPLGCPGGDVQLDFTPPFPSYPSGHALVGAAAFQILRRFYGRDTITFDAWSEELPEEPRHFESFTQAEEENTLARVYLGVHWIFDQRAGQRMGRHVGDYVFYNALRPLTAQPQLAIPLSLPDGNLSIRVSAHPEQPWQILVSEDLRSWIGQLHGAGPVTILESPEPRTAHFFRVIAEN